MQNWMDMIFPKYVDNSFEGKKIAVWIFMALAIGSLTRSLIHFISPDGGAGTIAGLDLSAGRNNIVFAFGLWGVSQLIYALMQLLVAFRYKSLIPLFYLFLFVETLGRMYVGEVKPPMLLEGIPPGGTANFFLLPLSLLMLFFSMKTSSKTRENIQSQGKKEK